MFGFGSSTHCPVCGNDVNKETSIKKFGKQLCSVSCAEKYMAKKAKEDTRSRRSGSC